MQNKSLEIEIDFNRFKISFRLFELNNSFCNYVYDKELSEIDFVKVYHVFQDMD